MYSILLFLCFLLLVNAPLDWLWIGITRRVLDAIHTKRHQGWGAFAQALLDFVLSGILLALVPILMVMLIVNGLSDAWSGPPVLDLDWT